MCYALFMAASDPVSTALEAPKPPRRKPGPPKLTVYEDAFIDAYIGRAKYSAPRAAEIVGLSKRHGVMLLREPRIRMTIRYRLRGRIMPKDAIQAELSDVGGAEWRAGVKDHEGKAVEPVPVREKVKALEVLARIQGLGREPVLVLLEKVMLRDLASVRALGGPVAPRLTMGDAATILQDGDDVVEAEVIAVESALDESAERAVRVQVEEQELAKQAETLPPVVEDEQGKTLSDRKL